MTAPRIEKITAPVMRQLLRRGGVLELETILLDGDEVWRAQIRIPDDLSVIYRIMVYHTMQDKYFKNLTAAFKYFREEMPDAEMFCVRTTPVEEITTE